MRVEIIRMTGAREMHQLQRDDLFARLYELLDARTLEAVRLSDDRVMLVDEDGYEVELIRHGQDKTGTHIYERKPTRARKPVNPDATRLYRDTHPDWPTHNIVGDVAVVRHADFK